MLSRIAALVVVGFVAGNVVRADDEEPKPMSPSTTSPGPGLNTPAHTDTTNTSKPAMTAVYSGTVTKINDKQISIKYSYKTGGPTKTHPYNKAKTVTKTLTFEIDFTPPVKVVTAGRHVSRTTGSYADVKVGDLVTLGAGPHVIKTGDGKSTTHTRVTGIDVLKHEGAPTTTTTTTTSSKS